MLEKNCIFMCFLWRMATPHNFPWLFLLFSMFFPSIAFSKSYGNWNQISLHLSGFEKPTTNALNNNNKHVEKPMCNSPVTAATLLLLRSLPLSLIPFFYLFSARVADSLKGNNWQSIAHSWPKFTGGKKETGSKAERDCKRKTEEDRERALKGAWKNADCHVHT